MLDARGIFAAAVRIAKCTLISSPPSCGRSADPVLRRHGRRRCRTRGRRNQDDARAVRIGARLSRQLVHSTTSATAFARSMASAGTRRLSSSASSKASARRVRSPLRLVRITRQFILGVPSAGYKVLVSSGIKSFEDVRECEPERLEILLSRFVCAASGCSAPESSVADERIRQETALRPQAHRASEVHPAIRDLQRRSARARPRRARRPARGDDRLAPQADQALARHEERADEAVGDRRFLDFRRDVHRVRLPLIEFSTQ